MQRERDVFHCMIKNLFEEYKYFPSYPEKELHITAQLFGGIIEHGLVEFVPLGLVSTELTMTPLLEFKQDILCYLQALRFVLDTVR